MTKKDVFRFILKVAGLYFLITQLFNFVPSFIPFVSFGGFDFWRVLFAVFLLLCFSVFFLMLIFKPDAIIRMLKLDKGFDDDIIHIGSSNFRGMLKIVIIALGISILIKQLPIFITHLLFLLKLLLSNQHDIQSQMHNAILGDYLSWGIKVISLVIGFLMVTNYKRITDCILKNAEKK